MSDLSKMCLSHLKVPNKLDHTSFEIEASSFEQSFEAGQKCCIKFSCAKELSPHENVRDHLQIEISDLNSNNLNFELKENPFTQKRFFEINFKPQATGCLKLCIRYRGTYLAGCPLNFNVLKSMVRLENSTKVPETPPNVLKRYESPLSIGRGRLFKDRLIEKNHNHTPALPPMPVPSVSLIDRLSFPHEVSNSNGNFNNTNSFKPIQSQKRKSDVIQHAQDRELADISTKLKRVIVGDDQSVAQRSFNDDSYGIIDQHLKLYENLSTQEQMPRLKAVFQRKFGSKGSFPIGVTVCNKLNLLIIAESGHRSVKVYDNINGELIIEIKNEPNASAFVRPSAVLVNENDLDLYIKDDVQVQVFDLKDNFAFKRRFGENILKKPYGLSMDTNENVVVLDADFAKPMVYVFNKAGEVVKSAAYEPVDKEKASVLNYPNLTRVPHLFSKTKMRFICCRDDFLYASDLGRSIVFKTDLDGTIQNAFGHFGKYRGELNEPSGIFVDKNGALLVGDSRNNRLQIYDQQGRYRCDVEIDGRINRPSDIFVDSEGHLYVSCLLEHCVKKFKLANSF